MGDSLTAAQTARALPAMNVRLHQLLFALALLPMMLIAVIIHRYGVNVPYGDEWSLLALFEKWQAHQLALADLYREHNGHRIFLPRLLYLALGQLTHGNVRAEMFFSLFLCALTSAGLYLLLRRTVRGSTTTHLALWAFINLFLFSPIQAENWLWGFQLQIFLSNLCLVGAIVCVTSEATSLARFAGAVACGAAGTFSFGNGLLIWPAVLFVLVCRRENIIFLAGWIGCAALVVLAYLPGYQGHDAVRSVINWLDYPLYFAGFLGAPLARIPSSQRLILPVIIGGLLVVVFLVFAFRLFRQREALRDAAPWLALGAYIIGSAILATRARAHLGPEHALDSRYTTVSVILLVSLIGLLATVIQVKPTSVNTTVIVSVAVGSLLTLYAINVPSEFNYLRLNHGFRARGKAALQFSSVLNQNEMMRSTLLIREDSETLTRYLDTLDRFNLTDPPRRQNLALADAEGRPTRSTEEYGVFEGLRWESPEILVASGWSYLPDDGRPPACIVLAYRSGKEWTAFALSEITEPRPDLVKKYKSRSYLERGWRQKFARPILPAGAQEISAWALDASRGETYRLPGSFALQ